MTRSVLVIEDELGIRDFLERGLSDYGYTVDTAADGTTGEDKALNGHYDPVVITGLVVGVYVGYLRRKMRAGGRELGLVMTRSVGCRLDATP